MPLPSRPEQLEVEQMPEDRGSREGSRKASRRAVFFITLVSFLEGRPVIFSTSLLPHVVSQELSIGLWAWMSSAP